MHVSMFLSQKGPGIQGVCQPENPNSCELDRASSHKGEKLDALPRNSVVNEPPRGKTNVVVSDQVRHKPACTSTGKR